MGSPPMFPGMYPMPPSQEQLPLSKILPSANNETMKMLREIPTKITRDSFVEALNKEFHDQFDFVFLPGDESAEGNRGFGFVNFKTAKKATSFQSAFGGRKPSEVFSG